MASNPYSGAPLDPYKGQKLSNEQIEVAGDKTMAETLRKVVDIDYQIDGLNANLVERLEYYQSLKEELDAKIPKLEQELKHKSNPASKKTIQQRLNSHKHRRQMTVFQILKLKKYLMDLVNGCEHFKQEKQELFQRLETQHGEWADAHPKESNIQEELDELDQKVKELEKIENANYRIANIDLYLEQYQDLFAVLDQELGENKQVLAPGQFPDYYPESGVLFDPIDLIEHEDSTILEELEKQI